MILLDLDGVCCDFVGHVLSLSGKTEQEFLDEMAKDHEVHPYVALESCVGRKEKHFWAWIDTIGEEFWHSMPSFDWFEDLYYGLKEISDVHFLTSAPKDMASAYSGKALWVERNVNKEALDKLIICPPRSKWMLAGPNRILIDDTCQNIEDWKNTGHSCFYFPSLQFFKRHPTQDDMKEALELTKRTIHG